jgi:Flp pilus assembly protein TadD
VPPAAVAEVTPAPAPVVQVTRSTPEPTPSKSKATDPKTANSGKSGGSKSGEKSKVADQTPLPTLDPVGSLSVPPPPASVPPAQPGIGELASMKSATTTPATSAGNSATASAAQPTTPPATSPDAGAMTESSRPRANGDPNVPAELLPLAREGKDQFERGNYLDAEKIYRRILAKAPNNLYTLSNLGVVLFRAKKHKLAEESFKKAIAVAPEDGFSHCTLGIVYYDEGSSEPGKFDDAVNELTKALAIDSKNATAHNYLGITCSQKGWQEAALKELETATALEPNYADAWFNLAVVYATQNPPNKDLGKKCYQKAVDLGAERDSTLEQIIK